MNWAEDLIGGIKQVTDVIETVGDFGEALGGAIDAVPSEGGVRDPYLVARAAIQHKITNGIPLSASDMSAKKTLESRGVVFTYPLEAYSGAGLTPGIQTTGLGELFDPIIDAAADAAAGAAAGAAAKGLTGLIPWWKGPGGKLQLPSSDPQVAQYLKQFSLDDSYLRVYYRAPRGYVVVRDAQGRPYAVLRQIAKQFGIWRPAAKPPISATDWKHYKRSRAVEKKLLKIARPALRAHSRPSAAKKGRK